MSNNRLLPFILFILILIGAATACKFFLSADIDWSGFSPTIAIGLFAGMIIRRKSASFLLPLVSVFIADGVIHLLYKNGLFEYPGYYAGQWKNYLILVVSTTLIGWVLKGRTYVTVAVGAVAAPTCYFLLSNFNVWISTSEAAYPKTFAGLMTCYEAALPFYRNGLFGTLVFLPVILLLYNFMVKQKTSLVVS
jgi:hypothetical protein